MQGSLIKFIECCSASKLKNRDYRMHIIEVGGHGKDLKESAMSFL